jgi:hypothetical protein
MNTPMNLLAKSKSHTVTWQSLLGVAESLAHHQRLAGLRHRYVRAVILGQNRERFWSELAAMLPEERMSRLSSFAGQVDSQGPAIAIS